MSALSDEYIKNFSKERKAIFNKRFSDDYDPNMSERSNIIRILNEMRELGLAEGGITRIGLKNGMKLSDFFNIQASGSKSGKQQIEGAPEGFTIDKETFNAIIKADIPLSEKIDLLASYEYGKGRDRIEKDDQELFLGEGGFKDRNIGLGFNKEGEGFGGTLMYNLETGKPEFKIGFKKQFNKGGRVAYQEGTPDRELYETPVTDAIKSVNEKTIDAIQKGAELVDKYTGIDQITSSNFPGAFDEASGQPSDFRHQAASNLLAEALGKGKAGPLGYLSGAIGASGLGAIKEIGDLAAALYDNPKNYKDAFSEFVKDNVSNIKGAFAKNKTSQELYDELMAGYVPIDPFAMDRTSLLRSQQIFAQRKKALEDAKKKQEDIKKFIEQKDTITPIKKPTRTVTGTTKPGTGGGGGGFTPTTTAQNIARTTSRVEDGRVKAYGLAKGGIARMLGE